MHANDVTPEHVRRLAGMQARRGRVLSLYLNLDPRDLDKPEARTSAVNSLLHDAREMIEDYADADHDARKGLRADLERIEGLLAPGELPTDGARALAVFADGPDDLLEVLRLPRPVESYVVVDRTPHVEPLTAFEDEASWCVALVNRSLARFMVGPPDALAEVESFDDDTHGRHDQGGWSQDRWERSVEKEVADHLDRVAETLALGARRGRYDRLLLATPENQRKRVEAALPPDVRRRLAGHLNLDVSDVTPEQVRDAARDWAQRGRDEYVRERLRRFAELRAQGARAAGGLDEVLVALVERRVETLLLHEGFSRPGLRDPDTGWLGIEGQRPPTEGHIERHGDITEWAIALAVEQDAEILVVDPFAHEELRGEDGIGAILRFDR
ncbi:MAG TPA: Vms1/Ankzf1 family peptidyl-tRNA hydrolase [Solirubrobacteraceae bacterium]|nr:Vms1/Ankzf1 family peptidyl-tRNA hydrolase [Solirubrobacteraceae bacterium]